MYLHRTVYRGQHQWGLPGVRRRGVDLIACKGVESQLDTQAKAAPARAITPRIAYDTLWIGNTRITDSGYWTTDGNGNLTASDAGDYNVAFNADTNTLTLNNANIAGQYDLNYNGSDAGIYAGSSSGAVSLTIQVIGNNVVSGSYGIYALSNGGEVSVRISGGGSLTASGRKGILFPIGSPSLNVNDSTIVRASGGIAAGINEDDPVPTNGVGIVFNGSTGTVYGNASLQDDLIIGEGERLILDNGANLDANGHNVIVDGGTLDEGIKNSLGDSVKYTPTITTASLSNGTVGTEYSTTLAADGTTPITWSVDSDSLPEGLSLDASTGVISGIPTAEGVSTFTVTAANVYGSDSREFTLNIDKPVVIPVTGVKLDKTSLTLQETGSDTSIATVDASGKVTAISAGSATITAIAADGSGKSASCSVTVYAATAITTQPGNVTVTEGSSATFTVAATGSNLTYQWQESTDGGSTWTDISGASNSSYTIAATTLSMNHYQYRCKITGTGGEVTSNAAALTVQEAAFPVASVTLDRTNLSLTVGHTAAITAAVEPANATNK